MVADRAVTAAEREAYAADGHICVRGLAAPHEIVAYRPHLLAAAEARRWETRPLAERDTYGRAFLQMFNLWQHDDAAARFVLARRFGRVAAELMGVPGVRLYHDQALIKEAGGGHTPWHQDQGYWPLDTTDTITMWMALDDIDPDIGSMTFASGSHRRGDVAGGAISDQSHDAVADIVARHGLDTVTHGSLRAGDATFHAGWTLHSAGPNPTDRHRPAMTVIYVADGTRIAEPTDQQRFDMHWLGGNQPGELVDSAMNPQVWPVPALRVDPAI
ncbi:MAG: phytanoyl-CoA dioxygenase family protein [Acidimicrobiia bacterium]|nr:phytanoyl-CoA dioxygenase family protein [Acidimicrobiia bacterium]